MWLGASPGCPGQTHAERRVPVMAGDVESAAVTQRASGV